MNNEHIKNELFGIKESYTSISFLTILNEEQNKSTANICILKTFILSSQLPSIGRRFIGALQNN